MMGRNETRIIIRCIKNPDHAKILVLDARLPEGCIETLAELLDGSSRHYIHKPGPQSPIGKCAICGGQLESSIQKIEEQTPCQA